MNFANRLIQDYWHFYFCKYLLFIADPGHLYVINGDRTAMLSTAIVSYAGDSDSTLVRLLSLLSELFLGIFHDFVNFLLSGSNNSLEYS